MESSSAAAGWSNTPVGAEGSSPVVGEEANPGRVPDAGVQPSPSAKPVEEGKEADPCAIGACALRGCCHNPAATEGNAPSLEDFVSWCLPPGESPVQLDATCESFTCQGQVECDFAGCRRSDGRCGIHVGEYSLPPVDGVVHWVRPQLGCIDAQWLVTRSDTGLPPDLPAACGASE